MRQRMICGISLLLSIMLLIGCYSLPAAPSQVPTDTVPQPMQPEETLTTAATSPTTCSTVTTEPPTDPGTEPEETTAPPVTTVPTTQSTQATEVTQPTQPTPPTESTAAPTVSNSEALKNEAVVLPNSGAAIPNISSPVASGIQVKSNSEAAIDYSNTKDGYVMVKYTATTSQRLKAQVKGPKTTYTYNLTPQTWAAFPLSDENGTYQITVYKNVTGTKYAAVLSLTITVSLEDEFSPFLRSNQYVNFDAAPNTVATAASLAGGSADPLEKVAAIYNFVVYGMTYDTELAATVTSGYLPDLDSVLGKMSGICFDYAALMTGMLRSQGVPTKLIIGYAGEAYHAWINVWSKNTGWMEGVIYFDGVHWQRLDPTFASAGVNDPDIQKYIGNGANYSAKYIY